MSLGPELERSKAAAALIAAIPFLNPTELRICLLVLEGRTTAEIASILELSIRTIRNRGLVIRKKLGVRSKLAVALMKIAG
ncbi:MAG TPA: LuxR C-terminal-related transcriptional regulator [Candidatus Kapabacteria bacterium]|jgi:DNA-binding CsgD family transcriptional regulator|nr:LuxR C-terminal-related transcriptional regulator [Candidatus Kapabacteria bacterium]